MASPPRKALCNYTGARKWGIVISCATKVGELIANYIVNVSGKLDARAERAAKPPLSIR